MSEHMDAREEASLEGVRVVALKLVTNERGRLVELQRRDDAHFIGFGQAYVTSTLPGVIKAWYRHSRQTDQIAVVRGLVKLVLYDPRTDSPTHARVQIVSMDERAPKLVQIPPNVWHGFTALGDAEAFAVHLNAEPFVHDAPDEERLPAENDVIPYRW